MGVHTNLDNTQVLIDGQFVSKKHEQVVLAIKEYSPDLRVDWLPLAARRPGQAAFKIVHESPTGDYVLFHVPREEDFDERVLQRIIMNDQRNGEAALGEVEAWEEAQKRVQHQAWLDSMEEAMDIVKHVVGTPLNTYRINKDLVFKDGIPHNAAHVDDHGRQLKGSEDAGQ